MSSAHTRLPVYNIFTHATMSHHMHGYWRHPTGRAQLDFYKLDPWIKLAKAAEKAGIDVLFMADSLGVHDTYKGDWRTTASIGMQYPSHDPFTVISALASHTEHLGLAVTSSILQDHPFSFARKMSTLDHLTNGRVGWNIVTSYLRNAATNYGLDNVLDHDERYGWADEYLDVVYKLWELSWEDGAVIADVEASRYLDASRIHKIHHVGKRYKVEGPHLVIPSPQRTPFLFQAGASEIGRNFSARHAEAAFLPSTTPQQAARDIADMRPRLFANGRDPDRDFRFFVLVAPIIGSTEEEAKRAERELEDVFNFEGPLAHLSEGMGVDLSEVDLDAPIGDLKPGRAHGVVRALIEAQPDKTTTFRDIVKRRLTLSRVVGTPEQVADRIQAYVDVGVGGFNIQPVTIFGWFEDFAEHLTPVLRRRRLMQNEYRPGTLREKIFPGTGAHLSPRHFARKLVLPAE